MPDPGLTTEIAGGLPKLKRREMHLYWLLDTSGSMAADGKIQAVNEVLRQLAPVLQESYETNIIKERGSLVVHALEFNDRAEWVSKDFEDGVMGDKFSWPKDLQATGQTAMGGALEKLAAVLPSLPNNAYRPLIALVTDGRPNDNFQMGLDKLLACPQGKFAIRAAIAIGNDADHNVCNQFIGDSAVGGKPVKLMEAHTVQEIKDYIVMMTQFASGGAANKPVEAPFVEKKDAAPAEPWI